MAELPVTVSAEALTAFIVSVLEALQMSPANASLTADLMVRTDLRGVDSHGIGMLPRYVEWTRAGFVNPGAEPVVARDDLATAEALLASQRLAVDDRHPKDRAGRESAQAVVDALESAIQQHRAAHG